MRMASLSILTHQQEQLKLYIYKSQFFISDFMDSVIKRAIRPQTRPNSILTPDEWFLL
jgi:hypothetical protein